MIQLTANGGDDVLTFGAGFGRADVYNFSTSASTDVARIDHNLATDFADLMARARTIGDDTVITLNTGNTLTFHGLHADQLQAYDFIFY